MRPVQCRYLIATILVLHSLIRVSSFSNSNDESPSKDRINERKTVVGGIFSPIYRYPYMVTLRYSTSNGGTYHSCGGTLIAPDIILSAAHCYNEERGAPIVIVGDHDFTNPNDGGEQFNSEVLSIHHNWDEDLIREDIMLFKISGQSTKAPVRLNRYFEVPVNGHTLTIVGWGRINDEDRTDVLKEATLEYSPCLTLENQLDRTLMCTKDLDGIGDEAVCFGDSGGPLIIKGSNSSEDIQVGIVSKLYPPCTSTVYPDMYTRVSEYYDWIRDHICASSSSPPVEYRCQTVSPYPSMSFSPSMQPSITSSPTTYKVRFTLAFRLDKYPSDVIWSIYEYNEEKGNEYIEYNDETPLYLNMKGYPDELKFTFVYETLFFEPDKKLIAFVFDLRRDGLTDTDEGYIYLYKGTENVGNFSEEKLVLWRKGDYDRFFQFTFLSTSQTSPESSPSPNSNQYRQFITVQLRFDDFPYVFSWGTSSLDYKKIYYQKPEDSYVVSAGQVVTEVVYLPASIPLRFFIYNAENRGLQGDSFLKVYEGLPSNETLLFEHSNTSFYREQFDFQLKKVTSMPSSSPSMFPSHSPSNAPINRNANKNVASDDTNHFGYYSSLHALFTVITSLLLFTVSNVL